jgi:hypothetical protein
MTMQDTAIAKLRNLPDPLLKLVIDFIDLLLTIPIPNRSPEAALPTANQSRRQPGSAEGLIIIYPDFDAPLEDFDWES